MLVDGPMEEIKPILFKESAEFSTPLAGVAVVRLQTKISGKCDGGNDSIDHLGRSRGINVDQGLVSLIGFAAAVISAAGTVVLVWIGVAQYKRDQPTLLYSPSGAFAALLIAALRGETTRARRFRRLLGLLIVLTDVFVFTVISTRLGNTGACTVDDGLQMLAVTPWPQVDLVAKAVEESCVLFPGESAAQSGATAADIKNLEARKNTSALMSCRTAREGIDVSCSKPHLIEYVGSWTMTNGTTDDAITKCDLTAREYTGRTFDSLQSQFKVTVLSVDGYYRCGVESVETFDYSLWRKIR